MTVLFGAYLALDAAAFLLFSLGTNYGDIAIVSPIVAASPLIALFLAHVRLHDKLQRSQAVGIAMILIGIIAIAL